MVSLFVVKVRHADGQQHPASSILNILATLLIVAMRSYFMSRMEPALKDLNGVLQVIYHKFLELGVGDAPWSSKISTATFGNQLNDL